jgi:hypothetical protein
MPGSDVPVIRQPLTIEEAQRTILFMAGNPETRSQLFDAGDEWELEDLAGSARETHYEDLLCHALTVVEAPAEQWARLGLN